MAFALTWSWPPVAETYAVIRLSKDSNSLMNYFNWTFLGWIIEQPLRRSGVNLPFPQPSPTYPPDGTVHRAHSNTTVRVVEVSHWRSTTGAFIRGDWRILAHPVYRWEHAGRDPPSLEAEPPCPARAAKVFVLSVPHTHAHNVSHSLFCARDSPGDGTSISLDLDAGVVRGGDKFGGALHDRICCEVSGVERLVDELFQVDYMYVSRYSCHDLPICLRNHSLFRDYRLAFSSALLYRNHAAARYRKSYAQLLIPSAWLYMELQTVLFRFSILRMFRLLRVFKPFRYNNTILLCVLSSSDATWDLYSSRTIEVMYVSVRRSQHALLAIGFFVMMVLTVFSTLLWVYSYSSLLEFFITQIFCQLFHRAWIMGYRARNIC